MEAGRRRLMAHAAAAGLVGICTALRLHPQSAWYPRCPIYEMFDVRCPGCGATRAMAALLQGRIDEALHWNALFVAALPFLAIYAGTVYGRMLGRAAFRWPQLRRVGVYGCVALVILFGVARDILSF